MSLHIDAVFQDVNALNLDAFKSAEGAPGFKNATVNVNGKTFNIAFADDGKVSVSFATTSFFHLFQGSSKTAVREKLQELVDLNSLTRDLAKAVTVSSHSDFVEDMLQSESSAMAGAAGGRFAHYGFSNVRESSIQVMMSKLNQSRESGQPHQLRHQLINDYNVAIGLSGTSNAAAMLAFVRDLNAGLPGTAKSVAGVDADDAARWRNYLKGWDLDMLSKIRKAQVEAAGGKTTGWAGEIARQGLEGAVLDMVRKNLDPRTLQGAPDVNFVLLPVARAVIEAVNTDFGTLDAHGIEAKLREIATKHAPRGREALTCQIMDEALTCAFWRQTSKRGLDFFKERGETVVFDWTKHNGEETDGAELDDKWWKDGSVDIRDKHGAAITNSEMRHLQSAKYAQASGAGRVIRVQGSLSQASAEAVVTKKIDELKALPEEDLLALRKDLRAAFGASKMSDYLPMLRTLVRDVPNLFHMGWVLSNGEVNREGKKMVKAVLERLMARIDDAKSPLVQTAMLANVATLFQAELLNDPAVVEVLTTKRADVAADAHTERVRTLAGLDHGRGLQAFFAPDTGRLNALGELLTDEATRENLSVKGLVDELSAAFAEKFGCAADEAIRHPAFRTFLVRAAPVHRDLGSLIAALDMVKIAHDAKVAVAATFAQGAALTPAAMAVFARRGDWDLNRLVFKEAVAAKSAGRPADIQKLRRNAEVLRGICASAVAFVDEVERMLGVPFTEDERNRLVDSYLDRDSSKVNAYRIDGSENYVSHLSSEHADVLKRTGVLVANVRKFVDGNLAPSVIKSLVIDGVATRAKEFHLAVATAALSLVRAGAPIALDHGRTPSDRVEHFVRELAARIHPAFDADYSRYSATMGSMVGYDDRNTIMRLCFNAYQIEHPEVKAFLDGTLDEQVLEHLESIVAATMKDNVMPSLLDMVRAHGQL